MLSHLPSKSQVSRYVNGLLVTWKLRRRGVDCPGRIAVAGPAPRIWSDGSVKIGSRVLFRTTSRRTSIAVRGNARFEIGERCFINDGVEIDVWKSVEIGPYCFIGNNTRIADTNYHEIDEGAGTRVDSISIGRNVWLASNVTVLPGVSIGDHSVVAACSVVTKSFPDRSLIAGIPARKIRDIEAADDYIRPG